MNAVLIRLSIEKLEQLIEAAKEDGASQVVVTEFEGKGVPECVCLVAESDDSG